MNDIQDYVTAPYSNIPSGSDPAIVLSALLKETHRALATQPPTADSSAFSLIDALQHTLEREFSSHAQQSGLMEEARIFLNAANIGSILEVAEHVLDEARENHLRDSDPARTVEQHVRELLANGDEPAALFEAIDKWRNLSQNTDQSESLRLIVAEEWARKLALEQQPPSTIHASLMLNMPDSSVDGHSHTAVAIRVHSQVTGAATQNELRQSHEHASPATQPPIAFVQPSMPETSAPRR